ncbi:asparaginase [Alkalicoccobacillus porphyridii]|uniref:asparaginase n=1 Tax=Alkalicoccobacillus porphyridii TaxID=2597270 RepID=A0A553ZZL5_9BACI|nr:asparaginase [Alkalicoccobacillus porphyridii]TSB46888.1 asparaginase [Alkalicoccobacillus porphyridii]
MKKVVLITTGGTIASTENKDGKLVAGELSGEELAKLCQLPEDIHVVVRSMLQKPSIHITFDDWLDLKKEIELAFMQDDVDGVVVTHGTDTLEETAYFLDLVIKDERPVIVTGSQRGPEQLGSDAFINLRHAIYAACHEDLHQVGTSVVFNERIFAARYVKKEHASNIQGFNAFGFGYLGIIDNDTIFLYQKPIERQVFHLQEELPQIAIAKIYLGMHPNVLKGLLETMDGVVIEGVGRGQVPPHLVPLLAEALQVGKTIVMTTSAEEGKVYPTYEYEGSAHQLEQLGVILGSDYDSKKARIKTMVLLASQSDVRSGFSR